MAQNERPDDLSWSRDFPLRSPRGAAWIVAWGLTLGLVISCGLWIAGVTSSQAPVGFLAARVIAAILFDFIVRKFDRQP